MNETSTTKQLILYLFNETEMPDSVLIQRKIDNDPDTEHEFENIKRAFRFVDRALVAPSPQCIQNILEYASRTALKVN